MTVPRVLRRWLGKGLPTWHHPTYRLPLASTGAPFDLRRADDALTWALEVGAVRDADVRRPEELSWDDAALVHTDPYLASLDRPDVVARILAAEPGRISVRDLLESWRRACRGTVEAVRHVLDHGGRAANLLGGFHHAEPSKGGGFCALNDVAIAIRCARRDGFRGAVLVIDLDAHPPDGIVQCLGDDPLLTVRSVSTTSAWEVPEARAARVVDVRVPAGSDDGRYLAAVQEILTDLEPADLAIFLAGADPQVGDALGGLRVSHEGLRARDRRVLEALGGTPCVALPAGGYHTESWRVLAGTLAELANLNTPVAPRYDPVQRRTQQIMKTLDPKDLGQPEGALLTEEELFGSLGFAARSEPRFLGYYTRHGLEHALTAYGYLTTLRRLGFGQLRLELRSDGAADRMVLTTVLHGERAPLVDLAVSIATLQGYRVLFVEWLELMDPRAPFTSGRPKLPGQRQPGLGLAEETLQLLVRAAERLDLAGISLVAAHYHVAWMARHQFVAVDPELRGRLQALLRVLEGAPLREATAALAGPGLPTEDGDPVRWVPVQLVCPLDPGLAEVLEAGAERAREVEESWMDRLLPWPR